jgi:hypothetical protein
LPTSGRFLPSVLQALAKNGTDDPAIAVARRVEAARIKYKQADAHGVPDEILDPLGAVIWSLFEELAATSATTLAGAFAKLRVAKCDEQFVADERQALDLLAQTHSLPEDEDEDERRGELLDQVSEIDNRIFLTPAAGLVGAAVKLRRLLDPELGIEGSTIDCEADVLRDVLAAIELALRQSGTDGGAR